MREVATQQERRSTVVVVASLFVVTLAVNLQVPLYKSYTDLAGHGQGSLSLALAAYVVGLIPVLLLFGGAAARFGNKATLLSGLLFALAAHAMIIAQPSLHGLLKTRVLQGASVGLTLGAASAYLVEAGATPTRAARLSGAAVTLGLGGGGLVTSTSLAFRYSLVPSSYWAVAIVTLACLCAASGLKKSRADPEAGLLRVPLISRRTLPFGAAIFLAWSVTGIILTTIPAQLAVLGQAHWSGLVVFTAIAVGGVIQLVTEVIRPIRFLRVGNAFVVLGMLSLAIGVHQRSASWLMAGATLSGFASFGYTYLGGLTGILSSYEGDRARAISGYYLLGYLGFGLPCVAIGYVTEHSSLEHALLGHVSLVLTSLLLWRLSRSSRARAPAGV
jgi:MFS family permease